VIPATEALTLPTAQLTAEEIEQANVIETTIEAAVREHMRHSGLNILVKETNSNVIAEVNQRIRKAGYTTQWQPHVEQHPLNKAVSTHTGFDLAMFPTDEIYQAAARALLS
jgi:creatinine amidohydrolase/Fe(II)-dependent formamide hydrolase-like protein